MKRKAMFVIIADDLTQLYFALQRAPKLCQHANVIAPSGWAHLIPKTQFKYITPFDFTALHFCLYNSLFSWANIERIIAQQLPESLSYNPVWTYHHIWNLSCALSAEMLCKTLEGSRTEYSGHRILRGQSVFSSHSEMEWISRGPLDALPLECSPIEKRSQLDPFGPSKDQFIQITDTSSLKSWIKLSQCSTNARDAHYFLLDRQRELIDSIERIEASWSFVTADGSLPSTPANSCHVTDNPFWNGVDSAQGSSLFLYETDGTPFSGTIGPHKNFLSKKILRAQSESGPEHIFRSIGHYDDHNQFHCLDETIARDFELDQLKKDYFCWAAKLYPNQAYSLPQTLIGPIENEYAKLQSLTPHLLKLLRSARASQKPLELCTTLEELEEMTTGHGPVDFCVRRFLHRTLFSTDKKAPETEIEKASFELKKSLTSVKKFLQTQLGAPEYLESGHGNSQRKAYA